jgi:hypothetical protein
MARCHFTIPAATSSHDEFQAWLFDDARGVTASLTGARRGGPG